jgi:hypothetical protein
MNDVKELQRLASPAPRNQSLAWDGARLWMGSIETSRIYAIDRAAWTVTWEAPAPGKPWGMTSTGNELRVLCGETADDNRFIRRCIPSHGFDPDFRIACPDGSGSQLGWDRRRLHVSQWYPRKLITLGEKGEIERVVSLPHGVCGQVFVGPLAYLVTTDAEETDDYWLTRLDPREATPEAADIARIPFKARALAFDGERFWTNHRERNQIVSFARPD